MRKIDYPDEIRSLIAQLKRLPGVGARSAERITLWLLRSRNSPAPELAAALQSASTAVRLCDVCGFFTSTRDGCQICQDTDRDPALVCIVEQATDVLPLERTGAFHGSYHSLHGRISPLDNVGPDDLRIAPLLLRLRSGQVREVILATGSDVEGEATSNYLTDLIHGSFPDISVTRLAQGLPAGGGLESADDLTLFRALSHRRTMTRRST